MGYYRAGFTEIVGIDIKPQPNYPFTFIQADALRPPVDLSRFDLIHASPPCQAHLHGLGAVNGRLGRVTRYVDLVGATRAVLRQTGKPYVIENVVGAPLLNPLMLCGSTFNLAVRRHRLFESSLFLLGVQCQHERQAEAKYWTSFRPNKEIRRACVVQVYGAGGESDRWADAMGIGWMSRQELTQAIPPAYTQWIGERILGAWSA